MATTHHSGASIYVLDTAVIIEEGATLTCCTTPIHVCTNSSWHPCNILDATRLKHANNTTPLFS